MLYGTYLIEALYEILHAGVLCVAGGLGQFQCHLAYVVDWLYPVEQLVFCLRQEEGHLLREM